MKQTQYKETILGMFSEKELAERVVEDLKMFGFERDHVGVLVKEPVYIQPLIGRKGGRRGVNDIGDLIGRMVGGFVGLVIGSGIVWQIPWDRYFGGSEVEKIVGIILLMGIAIGGVLIGTLGGGAVGRMFDEGITFSLPFLFGGQRRDETMMLAIGVTTQREREHVRNIFNRHSGYQIEVVTM